MHDDDLSDAAWHAKHDPWSQPVDAESDAPGWVGLSVMLIILSIVVVLGVKGA